VLGGCGFWVGLCVGVCVCVCVRVYLLSSGVFHTC